MSGLKILKFAARANNNYIEIMSEYNQWCDTATAGYVNDVYLRTCT